MINPYHSLNPDPFHTHQKLLQLISKGETVLEVGCATGYMSKALMQKGCKVTAIEIDKSFADKARSLGLSVHTGDATTILKHLKTTVKYDVILFADVLEHMPNPQNCLKYSLTHLNRHGRIIVSIPNVANIGIRLNLLRGNFNYTDWGIMDKTHLRFFTHESFSKIADSLSLQITHFDVVSGLDQLSWYSKTIGPLIFRLNFLRQLEYSLVKILPKLLSFQFIYVLKK